MIQVVVRWGSVKSVAATSAFIEQLSRPLLNILKRHGRSTLQRAIAALLLSALAPMTASAIPAFARKYGLPCSACHEAWPRLNNFGQVFKDTGYQLGNDRDSPIYNNPAYWPVAMRITPQWHDELNTATATDQSVTGVQPVSTQGFDLSGLDLLAAGTLSKNISFLLTPSADVYASFHFESAWVRFDNLLNTSWLNVKMGKFELDNVISEKRILSLSQNGGLYQIYHYLPYVDQNAFNLLPAAPGEEGVRTTAFGIGDNQLGIELMGHNRNSYTRYAAAVLSSSDGEVNLPSSHSYDVFLDADQGFNLGSLGLQRVGVFSYLGKNPTRYLTQTPPGGVPAPIPGTGYSNEGFSRTGVFGLFYIKKLDLIPMFTHATDNDDVALGIPSNDPSLPGIHNPHWNGRMLESNYLFSQQLVLTARYEDIRNTQQIFSSSKSNLGDLDAETLAVRWYPFMNARDGLALHGEYSKVHSIGNSPNGSNQTTRSGFFGLDFAF